MVQQVKSSSHRIYNSASVGAEQIGTLRCSSCQVYGGNLQRTDTHFRVARVRHILADGTITSRCLRVVVIRCSYAQTVNLHATIMYCVRNWWRRTYTFTESAVG